MPRIRDRWRIPRQRDGNNLKITIVHNDEQITNDLISTAGFNLIIFVFRVRWDAPIGWEESFGEQ